MNQEEMKGKPLLSVALCTYNGERFILEQLYSIINQQLPIDEIIICDDGSTDSTLLLIDSISKKCHDIQWRVIKNPQQLGVTQNFEKALSLCSGDIVFLSDQDDIWAKDKTKTIVSWFDSHQETELVFTDAILIDKDGRLLCETTLFDNIHFTSQARKLFRQGLALELFNIKNWVTGATIAFKKSLTNNILPFIYDSHFLHDEQIAITCIKRNSINMIEECLTRYRIHGNNTVGINLDCKKRPLNIYAPLEVRNAIELIYKNNQVIGKRISFLKERNKNCKTIYGRVKNLFNILKYIKYYKCFFFHFYLTDLTWGLDAFLSNKINFIRSKIVQ